MGYHMRCQSRMGEIERAWVEKTLLSSMIIKFRCRPHKKGDIIEMGTRKGGMAQERGNHIYVEFWRELELEPLL